MKIVSLQSVGVSGVLNGVPVPLVITLNQPFPKPDGMLPSSAIVTDIDNEGTGYKIETSDGHMRWLRSDNMIAEFEEDDKC